MSLVVGRTDDMLVVRGINVFPSQVEAVVVQFAELSPHYQLVVSRERTLDSLEVRVEAAPGAADSLGDLGGAAATPAAALRDLIAERLRGVLGIVARVTLAAPGSLPRSEGGKLRRVIDERPSS
jgi:phenylacetate-CoA ligase